MAFSQTYISVANGNNRITTNTTWSDSWYIVLDPVTINSNATLTISPNTNILIQCDPNVYFQVYGSINVAGVPQYSITFTEVSLGNGWKGIGIANNQFSSNFNYCTIEKVQKTANCTTTFAGSGAVFLNNATDVSFDHCTFQYNHTCYGAGLTAISSKITLNQCNFSLNTADVDGGAVYLSDVQQGSTFDKVSFSQNTAGNNGGAVYLQNTNNEMILDECLFDLNEAVDGGGLYFTDVNVANLPLLNDCQITHNTASSDGGGIYIQNADIQYISACLIQQNEAQRGGGLYIYQSKIDELNSNEITSNEAQSNGGGICMMESNAAIKLCQIKSNISGNNGGGIHLEGNPYFGQPNYLINCLIAENTANIHGGGISAFYYFYSFSNTIANNHAQNGLGGGIYHDNCNSMVVNTILWGNTATSSSQAFPDPDYNNGYDYVCAQGGVNNCGNCTGTNPDFVGSGSYMIAKTSSCRDVGDNNATYESIDLVGGNRITNNTIDIGAYEHPYLYLCGDVSGQTWTDHNPNGTDYIVDCDIYVSSGNTLTIDANTSIAFDGLYSLDVYGNLTATGYSTTNILFTATNPATGWSGINLGLGSGSPYSGTAYLSYCEIEYVKKVQTIVDNKEGDPEYSGAIFIYASPYADVTIDNCKVHDNYVSSNGGGILCYNCPEDVVISNSLIHDNEAEIRGGGLSLNGDCYANVTDNTFYYNTSNIGGGGIWIEGGSGINSFPYIYGNNIFNNSTAGNTTAGISNGNGGGIGVWYSNPTIENNQIHYNDSYYGSSGNSGFGGGIDFSNNSYGDIKSNHIYENGAVNGGGVSLQSSFTGIWSNILYSNAATDKGGGIYVDAYSSPFLYNDLVHHNISEYFGGGIYIDDGTETQIYNCTFADNEYTDQFGDGHEMYILSSAPLVTIGNTIADHGVTNGSNDVCYNNGSPNAGTDRFFYCCIRNFTSFGNGNIVNQDPQFKARSSSDYRISLVASSPCIGNGNNSYEYSSFDIRGNGFNRREGTYIDIGAYEYEYPGTAYKIAIFDSSETDIQFNECIAFPNPVENGFSLLFELSDDEEVTINIFNALGKSVYKSRMQAVEGKNRLYIERKECDPGIYFLTINSKQKEFKSLKLMFK